MTHALYQIIYVSYFSFQWFLNIFYLRLKNVKFIIIIKRLVN